MTMSLPSVASDRHGVRTPLVLVLACVATTLAAPLAAQDRGQGSTSEQSQPPAPWCAPAPRTIEPSPQDRNQARTLVSSARQSVVLGDLEQAQDLLLRAVRLDPTTPDAPYYLARVLDDQGNHEQALAEYCRTVALGAPSEEAAFARERIEALTGALTGAEAQSQSPDPAVAERPRAPDDEVAERLRTRDVAVAERPRAPDVAVAERLRTPDVAVAQRPRTPDEVVGERPRARDDEVAEALRTPERTIAESLQAPDEAVASSGSTGPRRSRAARGGPSPTAALTLGMLMPGLGHYYAGKPVRGTIVVSVVMGALASGFFVEKRSVDCLEPVGPGESCLPGDIADVKMSRPYLTTGIAVAGGVALLGALDAFFGAREQRESPSFAQDRGPQVEGPSIASRGGVTELSFLTIRMR